jgi:hypothetical protein
VRYSSRKKEGNFLGWEIINSSAMLKSYPDDRVADYFPRSRKECADPATKFFECFYTNANINDRMSTDEGQRSLAQCLKEKKAYETCMYNYKAAANERRYRVQEEYRTQSWAQMESWFTTLQSNLLAWKCTPISRPTAHKFREFSPARLFQVMFYIFHVRRSRERRKSFLDSWKSSIHSAWNFVW